MPRPPMEQDSLPPQAHMQDLAVAVDGTAEDAEGAGEGDITARGDAARTSHPSQPQSAASHHRRTEQVASHHHRAEPAALGTN